MVRIRDLGGTPLSFNEYQFWRSSLMSIKKAYGNLWLYCAATFIWSFWNAYNLLSSSLSQFLTHNLNLRQRIYGEQNYANTSRLHPLAGVCSIFLWISNKNPLIWYITLVNRTNSFRVTDEFRRNHINFKFKVWPLKG